ncbi:hypothetical protein CR513_30830, partial [Mucuna pruriens]
IGVVGPHHTWFKHQFGSDLIKPYLTKPSEWPSWRHKLKIYVERIQTIPFYFQVVLVTHKDYKQVVREAWCKGSPLISDNLKLFERMFLIFIIRFLAISSNKKYLFRLGLRGLRSPWHNKNLRAF